MRKIVLLSSVAIAFTFMSCKKDYSCTCTYTQSNSDPDFNYSYSGVENIKIEGATKTEARAACIEANIHYVDGTYTSDQKCELKK